MAATYYNDQNLVPLKRITRFEYGNSLETDKRNEDGTVPVYGSNGIVGCHDTAITLAPVIIIGRKGSFGKVSYSECPCFPIDTTYFVDERQTSHNLRWLFYVLQTLGLDEVSQDTGVPGLHREYAYGKLCSLVSTEDEDLIASFLDRETAKLDQLVEKKQRLIELLQEKHQALMTQAVTKGLDPNAPMKDSGIPWLGEVPAHWRVMKMTHIFGGIGSGTTPDSNELTYYDGDIPWVVTGDLNDGELFETTKHITESARSKYSALKLYAPGTLLVAMYGATIGKLAILRTSATTNQACCALYEPKEVVSKFAFYWFMANRKHIVALGVGGGQPNISQDLVRGLRVGVPPMEDQIEILKHVENETFCLGAVIEKLERQIELMKEYRQALISAVVTGQIDVRRETDSEVTLVLS